MVQVLMGIRGCAPRPMGHSLVTLFSLSVSVKDYPLQWILVRSQTYYTEHILAYGSGKAHCSLSWVLPLFGPTNWRQGWWRSKHRSESRTQQRGAQSPSLDGDLDPVIGGQWVGLACAQSTSGACVLGYPVGIHWFTNHRANWYDLSTVQQRSKNQKIKDGKMILIAYHLLEKQHMCLHRMVS